MSVLLVLWVTRECSKELTPHTERSTPAGYVALTSTSHALKDQNQKMFAVFYSYSGNIEKYTPGKVCHTCTLYGEMFQYHSPKQFSGIA